MDVSKYVKEKHDLAKRLQDMAALCAEQVEELGECQGQRDNALAALETVVDEVQQGHPGRPDYISREQKILSIAKDALERPYPMEDE